jgi:hypothetical protein
MKCRSIFWDRCNGCNSCFETGACKIKDDRQGIYPQREAADAIMLGSPVYFGGVTAQAKGGSERRSGGDAGPLRHGGSQKRRERSDSDAAIAFPVIILNHRSYNCVPLRERDLESMRFSVIRANPGQPLFMKEERS